MPIFKSAVQVARQRLVTAEHELDAKELQVQDALSEAVKSGVTEDQLHARIKPLRAAVAEAKELLAIRRSILAVAEKQEAERLADARETEDRAQRRRAGQYAALVEKHAQNLADLLARTRDTFRELHRDCERLVAILPLRQRSDFDTLWLGGLQRLLAIETYRLGQEPGGVPGIAVPPPGVGMYERRSDGRITPMSEIIKGQLDAFRQRIAAAPSLVPLTNRTASGMNDGHPDAPADGALNRAPSASSSPSL